MITKKAMKTARLDSKQKKFDYLLPKKKKASKDNKPKWVNKFVGDVLCPFCLHKDKIVKFLKATKAGYHKSLGKCPSCQQGMQLKSVASKWTPTEFAKWVFNYPAGYFWRKCKFKKWNKRLYSLGWSFEFWGAYRALKPKDTPESTYAQYLVDMGITPDDS